MIRRLSNDKDSFRSSPISTTTNRREFLKGAAVTAAAGMLAAPGAGGAAQAVDSSLIPTVDFCGHKLTRILAGSNTLHGFSHFNKILDSVYLEYFTDEKVVEFLLACQKAGMNTWQGGFTDLAERQYPKIRDAGVKMNYVVLARPAGRGPAMRTSEGQHAAVMGQLPKIAKAKPIMIAHHGNVTDDLYRDGKLDLVVDFLHKVHDLGFPAGISTHNPNVIKTAEEKGWPADFYQACFYCQSRIDEDFQKDFNVVPVGETFLSTDPPRMCKVIRQVSKPCLGFKILAAGRKCTSAESIRQAFKFAYENVKPTDVLIVGMFPKFSDQITENVGHAREFGGYVS